MNSCACCGNPLVSTADPDHLCPACVRAMDAGIDTGTAPNSESEREPSVASSERPATRFIVRPIGITLIASLFFMGAPLCEMLSVAIWLRLAVGRIAIARADEGFSIGLLFLVAGLTLFALGIALWQLNKWGRLVVLALLFVGLLGGGDTSDWWIRGIEIVCILYLMSVRVKAVFLEAAEHQKVVILGRPVRSHYPQRA